MDINVRQLNQLLTVARLGNFTRAAEALHITQPALSRSIAAFEQHFGFRIFDRGRGGASLTPLGAQALEEARALIEHTQAFKQNLHLYGDGDAGSLAFGLGPLLASMVLPELSNHFLSTKPKLKMQAVVNTSELILTGLLGNKLEMVFCTDEMIDLRTRDQLTLRNIGKLRIDLIVRSTHPLADKAKVALSDIADFPILAPAEIEYIDLSAGSFICDNYHILRETTLNTDGVWLSSPQFAADKIKSGELSILQIQEGFEAYDTTICEVRRINRTPSPASISIADYIQAYLNKPAI